MHIMAEIMETTLASKNDIRDLQHDMQKMEYRLVIKLGAITGTVVVAATTFLAVFIKLQS